jgi:hypothetical protein
LAVRRAAKIDRNQPEIVREIRKVGASVQPIHTVGKGCPDLLIGWRGQNILWEIKDGLLVPSARRLTDDETDWHKDWRGQVGVIESIEQALEALLGPRVYESGAD